MNPVLILQIATQTISAGKDLYNFIVQIRATLKQSSEWDDAAEKAFEDVLNSAAVAPHWQSQGK